MIKRPLGRGLSALLPTDSSPADSEEILEIQIDLIRPGDQQPRTSFQEDKLQELAQSIRTSGIIQPLLVRRRGGCLNWSRERDAGGQRNLLASPEYRPSFAKFRMTVYLSWL